MSSAKPIGVFDSGIGGLSVYRALREALPHEDFIYLGDVARLPYGTKSKETVEACTLQATQYLAARDIKFLTIACNTVSAQALDAVAEVFPELPCEGVIGASARAAVRATRNGTVAVLVTEGTLRTNVYAEQIKSLKPDAQVETLACGLLVALAEEGWCEGPEADAVVERYLSMLYSKYDVLVLGCTHFPFLLTTFKRLVASHIVLIDGAQAVAQEIVERLDATDLRNIQTREGAETFLVTDMAPRFGRVGRVFLGRDIAPYVRQITL